MKPIFISRPTWVPATQLQGIENFAKNLKARGLEPRTIGVTDYPSRSPMDEVIALMRQCHGAIVLGVPQICISAGSLKNVPITSPLCLSTEWNHIESALAYCMELPVLTIHDQKVVRGVFDRGAMNAFLHVADLDDPSWAFHDPIAGAIEKWVGTLRSPASASSPKAE